MLKSKYDLLKGFEGAGQEEAIIGQITSMLANAGFTYVVATSRGNASYYFTKGDCDYVFVMIENGRTKTVDFTVIDMDTYKEYFAGKNRTLNTKRRTDGSVKIICNCGGFNNMPIHRLVVGAEAGVSVDHISHNTRLNVAELLRECVAEENNINKPMYCKVNELDSSFSIINTLIDIKESQNLANRGYKVRIGRKRIYSPVFATKKDMYDEIQRIETAYLGEYRYNPLVDFSDTWYAWVLSNMTNTITQDELEEYQRDYMKRNNPAIADYYQL